MEPTPSNAVLSPLPAGAGGEDIRNVVENVWLPEIDKFQPDLMILSAGFARIVKSGLHSLRLVKWTMPA